MAILQLLVATSFRDRLISGGTVASGCKPALGRDSFEMSMSHEMAWHSGRTSCSVLILSERGAFGD